MSGSVQRVIHSALYLRVCADSNTLSAISQGLCRQLYIQRYISGFVQTVIHSALYLKVYAHRSVLDLRVCADSNTFSARSGSGSVDGNSSEEGQQM